MRTVIGIKVPAILLIASPCFSEWDNELVVTERAKPDNWHHKQNDRWLFLVGQSQLIINAHNPQRIVIQCRH